MDWSQKALVRKTIFTASQTFTLYVNLILVPFPQINKDPIIYITGDQASK
jgi:hypothetical protein